MDSEGRFWFGIWSLAALVVIALILGGMTYYAHVNDLIAQDIAHGVDPVISGCAHDITSRDVCLSVVKQQK